MIDRDALLRALGNSRRALLDERGGASHWTGELSTSALSTATALVALGCMDEERHRGRIEAAARWLAEHQNPDGGWGDTVKSFSNISTTLLAWSALCRFGGGGQEAHRRRARLWIRDYTGSLDPALIAETVKARYGKDRTFSVPILMLCAICGTLGPGGWRRVPPLPYELAALPREWFAALRLPVVSYALPALIAIGRARHRQAPPCPCRPAHWMRRAAWPRVSSLLGELQPASGGFLEAAPLTSFVTMALVAAGERDHPVAARGVEFLLDTVRPDGSWPIDTNLATWATTLAVKSLGTQQGWTEDPALSGLRDDTLDWLLAQHYRDVHPFTNAPPGGWAWTDLSGGVPDADDTSGALLALDRLRTPERAAEIDEAAAAAAEWLLDLQNRDGGIPTFCRGWGALPFDRSAPDLTAHALRAWEVWRPRLDEALQSRIGRARDRALRYLRREQRPDGSWHPLWFGNQHRSADEANPTYGTSLVVRALDETGRPDLAGGGVAWLLAQQNPDGGWGSLARETPSTVEETALALAALAGRLPGGGGTEADRTTGSAVEAATARGLHWLLDATGEGTRFDAAPVGFYFAKLWYYERIYPLVWTVEALARAARALPGGGPAESPRPFPDATRKKD